MELAQIGVFALIMIALLTFWLDLTDIQKKVAKFEKEVRKFPSDSERFSLTITEAKKRGRPKGSKNKVSVG